jgi:hypothetical protein
MSTFNQAVDQLIRDMSGYVAMPGSEDYEETIQVDNGRVRLPPAIIVYPRSAVDVGLALSFARGQNLPFTVKGGGHSAAGYCLNRAGVVLSMSSMKSMDLDLESNILSVQMGALWSEVYAYIAATDSALLPIGGGCLTVGLPGFLLGGGYSFASRSYGMGSDNILSIDFVTPDGEVRKLSADSTDKTDQDLWWACRGGGGGNFGVGVAMKLQIRKPHTAKMMVGQVHYRLSDGVDVIGAYNEWIETLPDEFACYGYLGQEPDPANPQEKIETFRITPVYNGDYSQGIELIQPMLAFPALYVELYNMTLPQWEEKIGKSTLVGDRQAYIRSGIMPPGGMSKEVIEVYQRYMHSAPSDESFVVWTHGGGQIAKISGDDSSVPHRDARYIFELKAIWSDPRNMRENVEWAYHFLEELRPFFEGAYVNYIDPLLTDWKTMYYGSEYSRLLEIKQAVDTDNLFGFQQGIGSDYDPTGTEPLDLSPLNRTVL